MSAGVIASSLRLGRARSLKLKQEEGVNSDPNTKLIRSNSVGIINYLFHILTDNQFLIQIPVRKDGIRNYPVLPAAKEEESQPQVK